VIRVLMMELNRISSHLVCAGHRRHGARRAHRDDFGFRERERILDLFEMITGLRMNHAYIRPGGVAQDLPDGRDEAIRDWIVEQRKELVKDVDKLLRGQPIWKATALKGVGWIDVEGCVRSASPARCCGRPGCRGTCARPSRTCGYETFDFEVPTDDRDAAVAVPVRPPRCASRSRSSSRCSTG
jgi:NADH-quinone oxidoreductase subunit D